MTHQPRKRFGQHFLEDSAVLDQIVHAIYPKENDEIVEIGPGEGVLTEQLLPYCRHLTGVEIDRDLVRYLQEKFKHEKKITIIEQDALQFTLENSSLRIVGNLPYNISTPLLFHLFSQIKNIRDMHFLLQKEVVDRLCAAKCSADYGRLSVMTQYYCSAEKFFEVPPEAFNPPPQVYSAFIRLTPHSTKPDIPIEKLKQVVTIAFNQRRKTISNSLKSVISKEELEKLNISPQQRAQELSVEDFIKITQYLRK